MMTKLTVSWFIILGILFYIALWTSHLLGQVIPPQIMYTYQTDFSGTSLNGILQFEYVDMRVNVAYRTKTSSSDNVTASDFSPNGRYLINRVENDLYILDVLTLNRFPLLSLGSFNPPQFLWSSNSQYIVYQQENTIYHVDIEEDGLSTPTVLIDDARLIDMFSLPNEQSYYLLTITAITNELNLYHFHTHGSLLNTIPLSTTFPNAIITSWRINPDKTELAFVVRYQDYAYLYLLDLTLSTQNYRQVYTYEGREISHLAWSSDGQYIAFYQRSSREANYEIMFVSLATGEIRLLHTPVVPMSASISPIIWSPNNQYLAFNTYDINSGIATLDSVSIDGQLGHQINIYPSTGYYWEDTNRLIFHSATDGRVYSINPDGTDQEVYSLPFQEYTVIEP